MKNSIYTSGKYLANNPSWHLEDSPWKAGNIVYIIKKNRLRPRTICEVGCGAGEILRQLKKQLPASIKYFGYEISPQAYKLCRANPSGIKFHLADLTREDAGYDLILIIDVIEHIAHFIPFLKKIRTRGGKFIFHVPLDDCLKNKVFKKNYEEERKKVGHLHSFAQEKIFAALKSCGYRVDDYFITPSFSIYPHKSFKNLIGQILRRLLFRLNSRFAARMMNGFSIMIYCR